MTARPSEEARGLRGRRRSSAGDVALAEVAALVHRLAVLLAAGVAPAAAWRHLARAPDAGAIADAAARAGPGGIAVALAAVGRRPAGTRRGRAGPGPLGAAWTGLAAAWTVSVAAGAPLAPTLRGYAELLRGFAAAERGARVALAGPRATARLVLVLPVVALAFGALLGQDVLGVLVGTPLGWACVAIGGALMLAGRAWTGRLLRAAAGGDRLPGLVEELTAVAMGGGVSVPRAVEIVSVALERCGLPVDAAGSTTILELAAASGAPAAELLRAEAEERRRTAIAEAAERAERLSVALLLPLGICVLPAFVAVGVVQLMAGIVGTTLAAV